MPMEAIIGHVKFWLYNAQRKIKPIATPVHKQTHPRQNGWPNMRNMWWSWKEQSGWCAPQRKLESLFRTFASPGGWDTIGPHYNLKTSNRQSSCEQQLTWLSCCIQTNSRPAAACWFMTFWILAASNVDSQQPFFSATTSYRWPACIVATGACMNTEV